MIFCKSYWRSPTQTDSCDREKFAITLKERHLSQNEYVKIISKQNSRPEFLAFLDLNFCGKTVMRYKMRG